MSAGPESIAVKARLDSKPGAVSAPASIADMLIYKVCGKMFAILSMLENPVISLKCDPSLIEILKAQYNGIGHRYHLDRRHWISVGLDRDVPTEEIERLVDQSYDLVRAKLTRSQKAELDTPPL